MSRPAPQQKPNFVNQLLLMLVVFFGLQMFLSQRSNNNQALLYNGKALVTRADYRSALEDANRTGKEETAQSKLQPGYEQAIDADVTKKVITRSEGEAEKLQGTVLVADTFRKAGLFKNDTSKIRMGYALLQKYEQRLGGSPPWLQPMAIWADLSQQVQTTPAKVYTQTVDTVKERNRTDPIWGFIPGGYQFIDSLVNLTGANPAYSFAFAAFLLAVAVRMCVFHLAQKQLMFSRQMSQLVPRINEIKDRYKDDQAEQQRKTMELYREYGINPFAGCLPAFIQMPLFFFVYQCMLHYQFAFEKGHFLWINPATSAATHGFIAADLGHQDTILIFIYGVTMLASTLLMPVTDPTQLKQQRMMGVGMAVLVTVFMFIGLFPVVSGFVLYWTFLNILATAQSLRAYRLPLPPLEKVNAPGGGVYPSKGPQGRWVRMMEEMQRVADEQRNAQQPKSDDDSAQGNGKPGPSAKAKELPSSNGKPSSNGSAPKDPQGKDQQGKQPKHRPKKRG